MFGYRPDGKKVKDLDPIQRIMPHIMVHRHDAQNLTSYDCPCEPMDEFIKAEYESGQKLSFTGPERIGEIRDAIDEAIQKNNSLDTSNGTDKLAHIITLTPNFLIRLLVNLIRFADKHGLLPRSIINLSPFHTTAFITNLKSIKGPSIFHHLYDFGNTGMFFAMGKESLQPVVSGGELAVGKIMPIQIVTDERFCDGFYFVSAMKQIRMLLAKPELIKERLKSVAKDTVVQHSFRNKK